MSFYLFPYDMISPGDNVVIYGGGEVGNSFLEQIEKTRYCNVVAVLDKNYDAFESKYLLLPPEKVRTLHYDKVLIAINGMETAIIIRDELEKQYSVPWDRIILKSSYAIADADSKNSHSNIVYKLPVNQVQSPGVIKIAFALIGGMGDVIIHKRFIEEVIGTLSGKKCYIDVFVEEKAYDFSRTLFLDLNVNILVDVRKFNRNKSKYHLAIRVLYILLIEEFNHAVLSELAPEFYRRMELLRRSIEEYGLYVNHMYDMGIHFARCKKKKLNAYTAYNYDGVFNIRDHNVNIPLLSMFEEKYHGLSIKTPYVTINYGWGGSRDKYCEPLPKIWPFEYYEKIILTLKTAYPKLSVVQIGIPGTPLMENADYHVNENIETLKYILLHSVLHIDSEGGVVHLATQLGTKCAVVFGQTPVHYFGYEENINIVSNVCNDCYYLYDRLSVCVKKQKKPECMWSITPEMVMKEVRKYLDRKLL